VIGTLTGRGTENAPFLQTNRQRRKWLKAKNGRVSTSDMDLSDDDAQKKAKHKQERRPASELPVAFICVVVFRILGCAETHGRRLDARVRVSRRIHWFVSIWRTSASKACHPNLRCVFAVQILIVWLQGKSSSHQQCMTWS